MLNVRQCEFIVRAFANELMRSITTTTIMVSLSLFFYSFIVDGEWNKSPKMIINTSTTTKFFYLSAEFRRCEETKFKY